MQGIHHGEDMVHTLNQEDKRRLDAHHRVRVRRVFVLGHVLLVRVCYTGQRPRLASHCIAWLAYCHSANRKNHWHTVYDGVFTAHHGFVADVV